MSFKWFGGKFLEEMQKEQGKRLERAAIYLKGEIRQALSVGVKRDNGTVVERSAPGEPPRLEEGELRRSMAHEVDKKELIARVGTNKVYGKYLELGTSKMQPRPFLRATLASRQNVIAHILVGGKINIKR